MTDKPLYNSRIIHSFVRLVERKYRQVDLKQVLRDSGIEPYEVNDEGHWFTQAQVNRLVAQLEQATGNPGISREAGQLLASVESVGFLKKYLLGLIGPANAFTSLKKPCENLTKSSNYVFASVFRVKIAVPYFYRKYAFTLLPKLITFNQACT